MVWDPTEENEERFLDNFLFTIAAINPPNASYKGAKELDPAEQSRFFSLNMVPDPIEHLKYLTDVYTKELNATDDPDEKKEFQGKLNMCKLILTSPEFSYDSGVDIEENSDDPSYKPLNYRSFKLAMDRCDGTKDDFLDIWSHYCNPNKKKIIETILKEYKDVDDKATQAIKGETTSNVFAQKKSNLQKLKDAFPELGL